MAEKKEGSSALKDLTVWFIDRKSGLLYTIYITSFFVFNWKFVYVLFLSSDKVGQERVIEALHEFFSRYFLGINYGQSGLLQFIIPGLITYLIIFWVPRLNNLAFRTSLDFKKEREIDQAQSEAEIEEKKAELLKNKVDSISSQVVSYEELEEQVNDLLSQVSNLEKEVGKNQQMHLSEEDIFLKVNGTQIKDDTRVFKFSVGKAYSLKIHIVNHSNLMAKKIEAGFSLKPEILEIKESDGYRIYKDDSEVVVRYAEEFIHANTSHKKFDLKITPLIAGDFKISTFVKGENFRSVYRDVKFEVIE